MATCGLKCYKINVVLFNLILWVSGIALLLFGLWMLLDPHKNYLLELVNIADQEDPLMTFATYLFIGLGAFSLIAGLVGCLGAVREIPCMLFAFILFLVILFVGEWTSGILVVIYRQKINQYYRLRFLQMVTEQYGRLQWVTSLVDKIQFFEHCCGSNSALDYAYSDYVIRYSKGSLMRAPVSCCSQWDTAWWDRLQPIDAEGCLYKNATGDARYEEGCFDKIMLSLDHHALLYILIGVFLGFIQIFGIVFACCLCRKIGKPARHYV